MFTEVHVDHHSVLLVTNDSFWCQRGFVRVFRAQKRVFQEKLTLYTSGAESAGVLQPYSRARAAGEKNIDLAPRCTNIEDSTPI